MVADPESAPAVAARRAPPSARRRKRQRAAAAVPAAVRQETIQSTAPTIRQLACKTRRTHRPLRSTGPRPARRVWRERNQPMIRQAERASACGAERTVAAVIAALLVLPAVFAN